MSENPDPEPERASPEVTYRTDCASQPAFQGQSGLEDQPGLRHLGTTQVRARTGDRFTETINDYREIFQELQIDPIFQGVFWSSVIYRYRQGSRHTPLLKRGTEASIKTMSDDVLRAYGKRMWGPASGWRSGLAQGEEMLLYDKNGANTRLHGILAKLWWRMRELVYEEKPALKQRGRPQKGRPSADDTRSEGDETYLADSDDNAPFGTDSEVGITIAPSKMAGAKVLGKLSQIADKHPAPDPSGFLSFQQTEDEIINLIGRLHDLRLASSPDIFERLWAAHIGRVEELEAPLERYEITPMGQQVDEEGHPLSIMKTESDEQDSLMGVDAGVPSASKSGHTSMPAAPRGAGALPTSRDATAVPFPAQLLSDEAIRKRVYPNYSSEPCNTSGNPIPPSLTAKHRLPPTLPRVMSIWVMTSPPQAPYLNRAYHHPAAPVQVQDQVAFFDQVIYRAGHVSEQEVKGYALSYGWCDLVRWIVKTIGQGCGGIGDGAKAGESEGERLGWEVFQKDLVEAAQAGVMVWRMKVLLVKR